MQAIEKAINHESLDVIRSNLEKNLHNNRLYD